jgi:hypothetical protein
VTPRQGRTKSDEIEAFTDIWCRARDLIAEERFLNWQISFPGVWDDWAGKDRVGGFDAVVGNPPWDRIKLQQVEWFAARRPQIALAQRASDRAKMIAKLKADGDPLFEDFQKADGRAADTTRMARASGHYPLLSRGDINLYSLFVERAQTLVKPKGMVGLLVPSGIASDLAASAFFRGIATGGHLKTLFDFENRGGLFPDVHRQAKFVTIVTSPGRVFGAATCAFFLKSVDERLEPERSFPITAADFANVNPNTGTAPVFRSRRDMALTARVYARLPVLVDRSGPAAVAAWPVRYSRVFDMTNDSQLFRTRAELEGGEGAWSVGRNRFQSASGEWVPLYEGKMIYPFDHRFADVTVNAENQYRPAGSTNLTAADHADPDRLAEPQYWVRLDSASFTDAPTLAFRDVTNPTDRLTMVAAIIPHSGAGNTLPIVEVEDASGVARSCLLANFSSKVFDYVCRQKVQKNHLNWYIVEQLPVVPPADYDRAFGPKTARTIVREAVLELSYTAHDLAPFARDLGHVDDAGDVLPPFVWDEERRLVLRAKLDALYFILYGVFDPADPAQSRDDIRYIYSTFPIVEREEITRWGSYRSRDLALAWINALVAGEPDAAVSAH